MTNARYAANVVAHSRGVRAYQTEYGSQPMPDEDNYPPTTTCDKPYQEYDPVSKSCKCQSGYVYDSVTHGCKPGGGGGGYPRPDPYPPISRCKREYGGSCNSECRGYGGYRCEKCVKECGPPNCGRGSEWDWRHKRCRDCAPWEDWYGGRCRHKFPGKPRYPTYWPPHIVNVEPPDVTVNVEEKAQAEAEGGPPAFMTGECTIPVQYLELKFQYHVDS